MFTKKEIDLTLEKLEKSDVRIKTDEHIDNITQKIFYKNNILYSYKICYKKSVLVYQLKENRKIILETKNKNTIKNKIKKIMGVL
jgi:hypothetical protein